MKYPGKTAGLAGLLFLLASLPSGPPAMAEISAELDDQGRYVKMLYHTNSSSKKPRIWAVPRSVSGTVVPLNSEGDALSDSWPRFAEDPFDGNRPYVVWSRFNGTDYDLVWSRWEGTTWAPVDWLERNAHEGVDQDPWPAASPGTGRPHLSWWSDEGGHGRVYLSIFLRSRWMDRYLVSDPDVDSRHPVLEFLEDNRIKVTYQTPEGPVSRIIVFSSPQTITDDIDPMTHLHRELQNTESNL